MKTRMQFILPIFLLTTSLTSCITSSVVDEIDETTQNYTPLQESKSEETGIGKLVINIKNTAQNTTLQIDSLEIYNIRSSQGNKGLPIGITAPIKLEYGSAIQSPALALPEQTITPWAPPALPENSTGAYLKIYGKLHSYIEDGQPFPLHEGAMYTPLSGKITEGNTREIQITLHDNCPIYCIIAGNPEKVLKSISFAPHVVGWE